ncbi:MAG TPA: DUF6291 domain-containing protein [Candidatus Nanopelagicaceae bacterium]|nr:DUF6291 domain-containing protein [Candidatus Nanopelagicaceae bacterium]
MSQSHKTRDSFIFYRSFFEAINDLPESNQLEVYRAISQYSLNFIEPNLSGISKTILTLIKPQLEANRKRFENGCKDKINKQKISKLEAKDKQTRSKPEANKNVNVNNNLNEESKSKLELKIIKKNFIPPTLEEIQKYCIERTSSVNANKFFDYYNAGNWKDAKGQAVKNWKQKLITWESKTNNSDISAQSNTNQILCDSVNKMAGHTLITKIDVSASNKAVLHFNNKDDFDKFTKLDEAIRNSVKNKISAELKTIGFEIPKFK